MDTVKCDYCGKQDNLLVLCVVSCELLVCEETCITEEGCARCAPYKALEDFNPPCFEEDDDDGEEVGISFVAF